MFDPSLMIAPNVGGMIQQGIEKGQQQRQQNMAKGALAALVRDPTNQRALEALAQVDPQAAMQFKQQQLEQTKAGLEQHRDNIMKGAQLIRQMNPKDDASWQQTLAVAHQAGIDVSQVPPHFDPQYIQGVIQLADTFAPQPQHNPQLIPVAPGGGVARWNPETQQPEMIIAPNEGGHQPGAAVGDVPQVSDQASYDAIPPGAHYRTPDGHVRVKQGGQAATPPATFPRSY